jgi:hypothetical protein
MEAVRVVPMDAVRVSVLDIAGQPPDAIIVVDVRFDQRLYDGGTRCFLNMNKDT